MEKVIAVIITYNIDKKFKENIQDLKKQVAEIVVVDNGSDNETIDILNSLKDSITLIQLEKNMGIAYALNRGIEYSISKGYEWILTLDHDSRPKDSMVKNMLETYEKIDEDSKKNIVMITPVHIEEKYNVDDKEKDDENWSYVLTEITSGSMVKASYYKKHLYEEKLFIDLVDHDFCLNINKLGYKIIQVKSSVLLHNLGDSIAKSFFGIKVVCTNHSALRRYYMSRNRLYIWKKYKESFPQWVNRDKKRFLSENIKIILFEDNKIEKMKMIIKGIKDYRKKRWNSFYDHKQ